NKKTFYEFCFLSKTGISESERKRFSRKDVVLFKKMHEAHHRTLKEVRRVLTKYHVDYHVSNRKAHIPYSRYNFVITVGGDGTFLQAASHLTRQHILGVNSDAKRSVGKFCAAFLKILSSKITAIKLPRFSVEIRGSRKNSLR
ncbi:MAG: NAD(+)/NADH kinase, partial [Candidatus Omnitrophica bacterium]|nr:NAD(+)/NADH kinase [Candidatus Omnitrophota bacterium]